MNNIPDDTNQKEPEELQVNFIPSSPDFIIPQIQRLSILNRTMGFESLINCTNDGLTPEMQHLIENGIFQIVISSFKSENQKIIGTIATALRRLSAIAQEPFLQLIDTIPFKYLFSVNSSKVIDFLQQSAENFDQFADVLLNYGNDFLNAIGQWLQAGEETAKSTLELIYTLSQIDGVHFDFNCIKPFVDGQFSQDIRALTLNILMNVEPENKEAYLNMIMSMFFNDPLTPTVIQVVREAYLTDSKSFESIIQQIYKRLMDNIEITETAVLLGDLEIEQSLKEAIIQAIFLQPDFCIERADAIFRLCSNNNISLPDKYLSQLATHMNNTEDPEVIECIEGILRLHPNYFATEEGQKHLFDGLNNNNSAISAFKICLNCCINVPIAHELLQRFQEFVQQHEHELDEELHSLVTQFLNHHHQ